MKVSYMYPSEARDYENKVLVRQLVGKHPDRESSVREGRYRKRELHWNLFGDEAEAAAKRLAHLGHPDPRLNIEVEA